MVDMRVECSEDVPCHRNAYVGICTGWHITNNF